MTKRVKVLSLLCAAALAAGALAGCSSGGSTAGGSSSKGTEISFMTWESEAMNEKILASFQAFEGSHEGVTVKLTPSPLNDYGTKIKSMISSRTAPDVFMVGNDWVIQYGSSGNLYDWTAKAEADGIESLYYPGVVDNWKVDGKLYGFPGLLNTYGVFYSKKALDDFRTPRTAGPWSSAWSMPKSSPRTRAATIPTASTPTPSLIPSSYPSMPLPQAIPPTPPPSRTCRASPPARPSRRLWA